MRQHKVLLKVSVLKEVLLGSAICTLTLGPDLLLKGSLQAEYPR